MSIKINHFLIVFGHFYFFGKNNEISKHQLYVLGESMASIGEWFEIGNI